jgi:hypothetical protein
MLVLNFNNFKHFSTHILRPLSGGDHFVFQSNLISHHSYLDVALSLNVFDDIYPILIENKDIYKNSYSNLYSIFSDPLVKFLSTIDEKSPIYNRLNDSHPPYSTYAHTYSDKVATHQYFFTSSEYHFLFLGSTSDLYSQAYFNFSPSLYSILLKFLKKEKIITQIGKGKGKALLLHLSSSSINESLYDSFVDFYKEKLSNFEEYKKYQEKNLKLISSTLNSVLEENIILKKQNSELQDLVYNYSVATWH